MGTGRQREPASIVVQRRIEWSDTDASGAWHNTAGFRLIEVAETALLDHLGLLDEVYGRLPRVRIEADFKAALYHRDLVDCALAVAAVGESSVTYDFAIRRGGTLCMKASAVAVLLSSDRTPAAWTEEQRALLLRAGPLPPERLSVS